MSETAKVIAAFKESANQVNALELGKYTDEMHAAKELMSDIASRRRDTIIRMHKGGWSYKRIGAAVGITPEAVYSVIKKAKEGDR